MALQSEGLPGRPSGWITTLLQSGRFSGRAVLALLALGFALALGTTFLLNSTQATPQLVLYILLADIAYMILLFGLIALRVVGLIADRRTKSAGAQLHLRLTGIFAVVAMAPTIIVAIFGAISISVGLEASFSAQVSSVVNNSLRTAQAYANEHRRAIQGEVLNMANDLNRAGAVGVGREGLADLLRRQQALRRFSEAYLIDSARAIIQRGDFSYTFTYDPPSETQMARARLGEAIILEDQENNELRALVYLNSFIDTFLYVTRPIDGEVLLLLDETAETVAVYNRAEASRERLLSIFALIYLGFALLVITAAVWLGLWFAERLSRPIGALAGAAQRVGAGDLDVKVTEEQSGDEVALLSRVFNRMTAQVKGQRDALVQANRESERRRNFIETVLSGVSAGVIGLDAYGRVEMANDAAMAMLGIETDPAGGELAEIAPALRDVFAQAQASVAGAAHRQVETEVGGELRELLVRVAARSSQNLGEGYVLTIDDLTDLVSAQREAAWGDVARRIDHEIKNPLTPIQLSAERLRRKFGKLAGEEEANFNQYTDVIVRQASDIRRMVDEFSKFARMPEPAREETDIAALVRDAALLQSSARPDIAYEITGADAPSTALCDSGMVGQALTNLMKNAAEAIDSKVERNPDFAGAGKIAVSLTSDDDVIEIAVEDNGVSLPTGARARLTEPYVTTREKGTGLGLAIVKKIAEQHHGALTLSDGAADPSGDRPGARATLSLPVSGARPATGQTGTRGA